MWNYALQQQRANLHPLGYLECFLWVLGFFTVMPLVAYAIGRLAKQPTLKPMVLIEAWIEGWFKAIFMMIGLAIALATISPIIGGIVLALLATICAVNGDGATAVRVLIVTFTPFAVLLIYDGAARVFRFNRRLNLGAM